MDRMLPEVRKVLRKLALFGPGTGQSSSLDDIVGVGYEEKDRESEDIKQGKTGIGRGARGNELGPEKYEGGADEYWDDLCLARFLEGVCLRFVAYPVGLYRFSCPSFPVVLIFLLIGP